ncbi:MAG: hypothetical protein XU09_C0005G0003 [Thaumarchaeota archaeon CSP1-1]|nr:MAG: hypothetical protein XU09_C0005G0003 [Thaumarchaeota archaeon CSP1-1]
MIDAIIEDQELLSWQNKEYNIYEVRCGDVLDEEGVRFAAIINSRAKLIAGGFKKGIRALEEDKQKLEEFMKFVIKISSRREYDESLGPINYLASRRNKVILISFPFPVSNNVLLVSAEPYVNIEKLAARITQIFGDSSLYQ